MSRSIVLSAVMCLILLGLVGASCVVVQARAEPVLGTISVEDPTTHLHAIDVTSGSTFKVDIWARDIPKPGVVDFRFKVAWNPKLISFVSRDIHDHGFGVLAEVIGPDSYSLEIASPFPHSPFINDASWVTLTFRCLGEGYSGITFAYSHGYYGDYDHEFTFLAENGTVNQHPASPVEVAYGGDKFAMLLPWLAAAGLVMCVGVVVGVALGNRRSRHRGMAEETSEPRARASHVSLDFDKGSQVAELPGALSLTTRTHRVSRGSVSAKVR